MSDQRRGQGGAGLPPDLPDPVDAFVEFGVPRFAAQGITDLLRGPVTDTLCVALPGVDGGAGVRWLWAASAALTQVAPSMARKRFPDLAPDREQTAALPAMWLHPIVVELRGRQEAAHPGAPTAPIGPPAAPTPKPDPHPALRQSFDGFREAGGDPAVVASGREVARVLKIPTEGEDPAWGGWSLLATISAFDEYGDLLPLPGRPRERLPGQEAGARSAGLAFAFGRDLIITTAVALLDPSHPQDRSGEPAL